MRPALHDGGSQVGASNIAQGRAFDKSEVGLRETLRGFQQSDPALRVRHAMCATAVGRTIRLPSAWDLNAAVSLHPASTVGSRAHATAGRRSSRRCIG